MFRLEGSRSIHEVGLAGAADLNTFHKFLEVLRIDGRAEIPGAFGGFLSDRDDEVRNLPHAEKDVGHVEPAIAHGVKPIGLGIVLSGRVVGPDVGEVISLLVEHTEIEEGLGTLLESGSRGFDGAGLLERLESD